jgi:S-adenosylmethionine synthetase
MLTQKHNGQFYQTLPVDGHFGANNLPLPWEDIDKAVLLVD